MPSNFEGFVGNLNELVQDFFTTTNLTYDPVAFSNYPDKYSYIYSALIKTKGDDMIKMSNLQNYLSEFDRSYTFGGFRRIAAINAARPLDPPTFANGSSPDNGQIRKADILATYHPLKVRTQFLVTNFTDQLKEAVNSASEMGLYVAGVLRSLADGANDTLFRLYKEIFHKFYSELSAANKTALTNTNLPATITSVADAITAINTIRNYTTEFMFGSADYSATGFRHTVIPARQRLYINHVLANAIVDFLKLEHWMGDVNYADIAGSISQYLGIPVKMLDDFGGMIPYDTNDAQLFPIFDADGAVTGTYAATAGGTTSVPVDHWGPPADYTIRAVLTEDDFGNVFPVNDNLQTANFILGGGYINTARYIERQLVPNPHSNTIYFE